jgi:hypothetical protein
MFLLQFLLQCLLRRKSYVCKLFILLEVAIGVEPLNKVVAVFSTRLKGITPHSKPLFLLNFVEDFVYHTIRCKHSVPINIHIVLLNKLYLKINKDINFHC